MLTTINDVNSWRSHNSRTLLVCRWRPRNVSKVQSLPSGELLLFRFLITLCIVQPFQERLGGLADLFAGSEIDILF